MGTSCWESVIESFMNKLETYFRRWLWFVVLSWVLVAQKPVAAAEPQIARTELTALDKYVAAPDTNYSFHLVSSVPGQGQTTFVLEMTSQAWLTTNEVDRPL